MYCVLYSECPFKRGTTVVIFNSKAEIVTDYKFIIYPISNCIYFRGALIYRYMIF